MSTTANSPEKNLRQHLLSVGLQGVLFVLNLPDTPFTRRMVFRLFPRLFTNVLDAAVEFDRLIGEQDVRAGCEYIALRCGTPPEVSGLANLPKEGPLLLASNHPGYFDSMVVVSQLPRSDVRVVVGGVPYFNEMPNAKEYLYYTDHTPQQSVRVLRDCVRHLRKGGCVMIFPTGLADPDPDYMDGAHERITQWSESLAVMMRQAADTSLVPVTVSGILAPKFMRHPIARLQAKPRIHQRVAEFFQMYYQFRRAETPPFARPRVSFGAPLTRPELEAAAGGKEIMPEVIAAAQQALAVHMQRREKE